MSRFTIIGAGGLGGPIAYALAAAGAEGLTLIDDDEVDLSNLQRQVQFTTRDVGRPKVEALADELVRRGYPPERIHPIATRLTLDRAPALLSNAAVVIDGSDNFPTKFAVNDASVAAGIPFVIGGVLRYSGQVLGGVPGETGCYRCVFEAPPPDSSAADSCTFAGVLGASVAVIAGHVARVALALAGGDVSAAGQLIVFDDLAASAVPRRVRFRRRSDCPACESTSRAAAVEAS